MAEMRAAREAEEADGEAAEATESVQPRGSLSRGAPRRGMGGRVRFEGALQKVARQGAVRALGHRTSRWFVLTDRQLSYYMDASLLVHKGMFAFDYVSAPLSLEVVEETRALRLAAGGEAVQLYAADRSAFENWSSHLDALVRQRAGAVSELSAEASSEHEAARVLQGSFRKRASERKLVSERRAAHTTSGDGSEAVPAAAADAVECS